MDNLFIWLAAVLLTSAAVCSMIGKIKKKKKKDQVLHNRDSVPEETAVISIPGRRLILYLASEHFFWRPEIKSFSLNTEKLEMTICISQHL